MVAFATQHINLLPAEREPRGGIHKMLPLIEARLALSLRRHDPGDSASALLAAMLDRLVESWAHLRPLLLAIEDEPGGVPSCALCIVDSLRENYREAVGEIAHIALADSLPGEPDPVSDPMADLWKFDWKLRSLAMAVGNPSLPTHIAELVTGAWSGMVGLYEDVERLYRSYDQAVNPAGAPAAQGPLAAQLGEGWAAVLEFPVEGAS